MPASTAASASARAGGPPTAKSAARPAAAAARPLSRCFSSECAPSSSISPSTATLRAARLSLAITSSARLNAAGLEL